MATRKFVRNAIFIDDAFARPTVSQIQPYLGAMRSFLSGHEKTKLWLDKHFSLSGNHLARAYFDPLISSADQVLKFWAARKSSPDGDAFEEIFADLSEELSQHHSPLETISGILHDHKWNVTCSAVLPEPSSVGVDVSLIVIDYQLSQSADDLEAKVQESIDFLRTVVEAAKNAPNAIHPFIILISSLPSIAGKHSIEFRVGSSTPGGMFRFVRKINADSEFLEAVESFYIKSEELQKFRCLHIELEKAVAAASLHLGKQVAELELEDLATLYTAQLVTEKEPLSDYVGWLAGQLVMSSIQKNHALAQTAMDLPDESYQILLGHCQPTQQLSEVFSEFSSVQSAAGELTKLKKKSRDVRFGDIYLKKPKLRDAAVIEAAHPYYLVISQTCDLLQGKITNGQVLCVQGKGREVRSTEIDLQQATIRQMDSGGNFLIKSRERYFQIEWSEKDLLTIDQRKLSKELGFDYIGRLNEIYALEVQHSALQTLGRIGVPIVPGYRVFFGVADVKVFDKKGSEIIALRRTLNNNSVLGVLRNEKIRSVKLRLLFSGELQRWLYATTEELLASKIFPEGNVVKGVEEFLVALKQGEPSYSLTGKAKGEEVEGFRISSSVILLMRNLPQVTAGSGQARIQIELTPSIHFAGDSVA